MGTQEIKNMNSLDFDRQARVLAFLIGNQATAELFKQTYQEMLDDLKAEVEAGQKEEVIMQRIGRLKLLLFVQTLWVRVQSQQASGGDVVTAGEVGLA